MSGQTYWCANRCLRAFLHPFMDNYQSGNEAPACACAPISTALKIKRIMPTHSFMNQTKNVLTYMYKRRCCLKVWVIVPSYEYQVSLSLWRWLFTPASSVSLRTAISTFAVSVIYTLKSVFHFKNCRISNVILFGGEVVYQQLDWGWKEKKKESLQTLCR